MTLTLKSVDFGKNGNGAKEGFVERSEFFAKLAVAEARVHTGVPPITKIPMDPDFLGEFGTRSTIAAWRHSKDLGIFVGDDSTHQLNPIIIAICETRNGTSVYKQMAFAEEAWKYYHKQSSKKEPEPTDVSGKPKLLANLKR